MSNFDRSALDYKFSLSMFKKNPSKYNAYSVYIHALETNNPIPAPVLKVILPDIERLYSKIKNKISKKSISLDEHKKKINASEKDPYVVFDCNEKLLCFAMEEKTIKAACDKFIESEGAAVENSVRQQLNRILKREIDNYINSQPAINKKHLSEHYQYTGTDAANMLRILKEIIAMEAVIEE